MHSLTGPSLTVALITDVFVGAGAKQRLGERLREAKQQGGELAVLPELPLNSWCAVSKTAREEDAEPPGGPRQKLMSQAAKEGQVGLLGGAILRDSASGHRHNTAVLYDTGGRLLLSYRKAHLPNEEGYWEACHYQPGDDLPAVISAFGLKVGVQVCSDVNRPEGCHVLGALGADVILVPRATPAESYERWETVLRANAVTSTAYVVSVNRPRLAAGEWIGGPSLVIAPNGKVLLETTDPVRVITLSRADVLRARQEYPGYLPVRSDLYARAWGKTKESR